MRVCHSATPARSQRGERRDLNPRPLGPQPSALPPELRSPRSPLRRSDAGPKARLAGFEPAAHGLEVRCSIQLSYRRTFPTAAVARDRSRSGRRDSNPRQPAWKAGALPTELHPPVHVLQLHLCHGRDERIRTSDPLLPKQVRYQTAPRPDSLAAPASVARVYRIDPPPDPKTVSALHLNRHVKVLRRATSMPCGPRRADGGRERRKERA